MKLKAISTQDAPAAIGPYAQAVKVGKMVYTSGQLGLDPATGNLEDGLEAQAHRAMKNLKAVLKEAGTDFSYVVKTTIFLTDMANFAQVNEVYGSYFDGTVPARSTVAVAGLPKGGLVEIEAVALVED